MIKNGPVILICALSLMGWASVCELLNFSNQQMVLGSLQLLLVFVLIFVYPVLSKNNGRLTKQRFAAISATELRQSPLLFLFMAIILFDLLLFAYSTLYLKVNILNLLLIGLAANVAGIIMHRLAKVDKQADPKGLGAKEI